MFQVQATFFSEDGDDDDVEKPTKEQCQKYIKECPKGEKGDVSYSLVTARVARWFIFIHKLPLLVYF
jgi:hypothetical protein